MGQVKTVCVRVDASTQMGHGHVMRCLALADALREESVDVFFVSRQHEGHLCNLIEDRGFTVFPLPVSARERDDRQPLAHAEWLGGVWSADANQTREAIRSFGQPVQWLVVDHYALDSRWETYMRDSTEKIMVIDDLADRVHDCDLLLDQNLIAGGGNRYSNRVPAGSRVILGPKYALVRSDFAELRERLPPRKGPIGRILVSMGGVDSENLTGQVLAALSAVGNRNIEVDVVLSTRAPHFASVRRHVEAHPNLHLHSDLPTLAPLMAGADLGVGGGGGTSWERLCLGLPSLIVSMASNQRAVADALHRDGLAIWLGNGEEVSDAVLTQALGSLMESGLDEDWSVRCFNVVDGRGAQRVSTALSMDEATPLLSRLAGPNDLARVVEWADGGLDADELQRELRRVSDVEMRIVVTLQGIAVGLVRFDRHPGAWQVGVTVAPWLEPGDLSRRILGQGVLDSTVKRETAFTLRLGDGWGPDESVQTLRVGICSGTGSWMTEWVPQLVVGLLMLGHEVTWTTTHEQLPHGDICCFLSYGKIVGKEILARHRHNVVVHASGLPAGRGRSPLTWQILEGSNTIPVTLFEAAESVDSGPIYDQIRLEFAGLELIDELRAGLATATVELCERFVRGYPESAENGVPQMGEPTFYESRRPADSRLDPSKSILDQFNLLRVADPERYPAWVDIGDRRFVVKLERLEVRGPKSTLPKDERVL